MRREQKPTQPGVVWWGYYINTYITIVTFGVSAPLHRQRRIQKSSDDVRIILDIQRDIADDLFVAATHGTVDRIAQLIRDVGHDPNRCDHFG